MDEHYTPEKYTETFRMVWPHGFDLVLIDGEYKAVAKEENPHRKIYEAQKELEERRWANYKPCELWEPEH